MSETVWTAQRKNIQRWWSFGGEDSYMSTHVWMGHSWHGWYKMQPFWPVPLWWGLVLEQNGEGEITTIGCCVNLMQVVRGEHGRRMDGGSSNIGYPVKELRLPFSSPLSVGKCNIENAVMICRVCSIGNWSNWSFDIFEQGSFSNSYPLA